MYILSKILWVKVLLKNFFNKYIFKPNHAVGIQTLEFFDPKFICLIMGSYNGGGNSGATSVECDDNFLELLEEKLTKKAKK